VIANFYFKPKTNSDTFSKSWCFVNPSNSTLLPGEKLRINVSIQVADSFTASTLNFGVDKLEDCMILHTENGKDHFVSVSGEWVLTSFGNDLGVLCKLLKPVREYDVSKLKEILVSTKVDSGSPSSTSPIASMLESNLRIKSESPSPSPVIVTSESSPPVPDPKPIHSPNKGIQAKREEALTIPKEIWRLVDLIYKYGMDVVSLNLDYLQKWHLLSNLNSKKDNIFTTPGNPHVIEYLRECLDSAFDFDIESLLLDEEETSPTAATSPTTTSNDSETANKESDPTESLSKSIDFLADDSNSPSSSDPLAVKLDVDLLLKSKSSRNIAPVPPKRKGRIVSIHSAVECLLKLLDGCLEPVIPVFLHDEILSVDNGIYSHFPAAKNIVQTKFPIHH
jgi:hypothetical protein